MTRLQATTKNGCAAAIKKFDYKSIMEVPRITKVTLNMGVGEARGR